jgi:glucose dehydrogenase
MVRETLLQLVRALCTVLCAAVLSTWAAPISGQERGTPPGEWLYWGGDAWSTRYSPLDQINADNFESLEVAWIWRGDNYSTVPQLGRHRSTPRGSSSVWPDPAEQ